MFGPNDYNGFLALHFILAIGFVGCSCAALGDFGVASRLSNYSLSRNYSPSRVLGYISVTLFILAFLVATPLYYMSEHYGETIPYTRSMSVRGWIQAIRWIYFWWAIAFPVGVFLIISGLAPGAWAAYKKQSAKTNLREAYNAKSIATISDLNRVTNQYGFYIGAPYWHWFGDGHILTVGAIGDGKNAALIIPNFISPAFLATGTSVFCLDPKGENYYVCKEEMIRQGYNVYRLNPADIFEMGSDHFNLFDMIRADSPHVYAFCADIASALSPLMEKSDTGDHFSKKVKSLLVFYMLYMIDTEGSNASFVTLYDWLTYGGKDRKDLLDKMAKSKSFEGIIAGGANGILAGFDMGGEREMSGVFSTASNAIEAFSNPQIRRIVRQSDFSLQELIDKPTAVFINIPFKQLKDTSGWVRSMISVLSSMMETRKNRDRRLLFMLDEFVQIGHVKEVLDGFITLRGFGVTYHIVVQDMQLLKKVYPGAEKAYFSSAAVINALRVKDPEMAKILSDMTGKDVNMVDMGDNHAPHVVHKQVVTPDEFQNNDGHYLFLNGMPNVIKLPKTFYFKNPNFNGRWKQNPLHRKSYQP